MPRQPLSLLPRALIDQGFGRVTYNRAYHAALAGLIPIERTANGRWIFDPADVPQIAERLGLTPAVAA